MSKDFMMPSLEDLPNDVYALFNPDEDHECNEDYLNEFAENVKDLLRRRLAKQEERSDPLRFSALGRPDRQVWYEAHPEEGTKEPLTPKTFLKFVYGDVIEQLYLFLAKEAGHTVEQEQAEVEADGVLGHIDAIIDGVVVDVKSASSYGYKKFKDNSVEQDDPFGYVAQLAGYSNVLTPGKDAAWWAIDKVSGANCISTLKKTVIEHHQPLERISHLKEVIASDRPPERCYEDIPDGKSGNRKLDTGCSYCAHKFRCWPGLRTFIYSTGPRYLTSVSRTPDVPEVSGFVDGAD
jgi:hypothetical protein